MHDVHQGNACHASMKGFPRRGSDAHDFTVLADRPSASMKGFPRRGSDVHADILQDVLVCASMKGFPRRGSDELAAS